MQKIEDLAKAVREAQEAYDDAEREARRARNKETDALNRLNEAQRAFDSAVDSMRKSAPRASDWKRDAYAQPRALPHVDEGLGSTLRSVMGGAA